MPVYDRLIEAQNSYLESRTGRLFVQAARAGMIEN